MDFERRCWAEVDLDALRHNFSVVRHAAAGTDIMAVVKANAYGHGDVVVAKMMDREGAARFAVATLDEALRLRRCGIKKPIQILGYTDPAMAATLAKEHLIQTVFSLEYARVLSAAARAAGVYVFVHIKVDTGMGRLGFAARDDLELAVQEIAQACGLPSLSAEGIFTHFAVADSFSPSNKAYTEQQAALLQQTIALLRAQDITFVMHHCCNSAGTFLLPDLHMNLVRPGIVLYGENPSEEVALPGLRRAMQLKTVVSQVKTVPAGDSVSYGRTFTCKAPMRLATLCIGYADGYPRVLSNRGIVEIKGQAAHVVGRVCMDQMVVDVSHIDSVKCGDIATVFGGYVADSVGEIARATDTIPYEVLCNVGHRVPRIYLEHGRVTTCCSYLREENI